VPVGTRVTAESVRESVEQSAFRLASAVPTLAPAVGIACGIVLDRYCPLPWSVHLLSILAAGALLYAAVKGRTRTPFTAASLALILAAASAGALRHQVAFWRLQPDHIALHVPPEGTLATIRGVVLTEPSRGTWRTGGRRRGPANYRFLLQSREVLFVGGWRRCSGLIRMISPQEPPHIRPGDVVQVFCQLKHYPEPQNPGQFDWQLRARRFGVLLIGKVSHPLSIRRISKDTSTGRWRRLLERFRRKWRSALLDGLDPDSPQAGLLRTVVAGHRTALAAEINAAFRASGTSHFLAVSGMHVGMIAAAGWLFGWLALGRPKRAALAALAAVVLFALSVEPRAPAMRASIMAVLAVLAVLTGRPFNAANWLTSAAAVLLLIRPADLFTPGFQLSFAVVAGLLLASPTLHRALFGPRDAAGFVRLQLAKQRRPLLRAAVIWPLQRATSASVGAWLVASPLLAYHFGLFNPYAALATLLMLPIVFVVVVLGFVKVVAGTLLPSVNLLLAPTLAGASGLMMRWAERLGSLPYASLQVVRPPAWEVVAAYGVIALWVIVGKRKFDEAIRPLQVELPTATQQPAGTASEAVAEPRPSPPFARFPRPTAGLATFATACLAVAYAVSSMPAAPPQGLAVYAFAVGDGLAVAVRLPGGKNILYDCGSLTLTNPGASVVVPSLEKLGIRKLHAVVLSHPNLDHYNGMFSLTDQIPVDEVLVPECFIRAAERGTARLLLEELNRKGIPVLTIKRGDRLTGMGRVVAEVLWPPASVPVKPLDANDCSAVLKLTCDGRTVLLTGDIGPYPQTRLACEDGRALRCDLLLLPHHGRPRTLRGEFLAACRPAVAIASSAEHEYLTELASVMSGQCMVLATARSGMISVNLQNGAESVETFCRTTAGAICLPLRQQPGSRPRSTARHFAPAWRTACRQTFP